ncbi:hypothetical protein AMJ52_03260 [candidate division TA06 bacterium DG_78]|uniref:Two component regulator three Y domain-containing protein n=1 Tax=candidate division TA06 bacterium DG_78 TaxID=1703772 RepID=A0A0S7YG54_UNCT6|nr:MAG: hypothetical protein AMJ52_03260 [candidate division TA06 bacterium DG_78]
MIELLIILITISQKQIGHQPVILDGITDIYASEFIFLSTPYGIYTFDRHSEIWGRITQAHGLPDNQIDIIGLDEGILWVATPGGLASADIRLNDWQTYDLPGTIEGVAFDDEYVWVAGDFGIKRFDKYIETWEEIAHGHVRHIVAEKKHIWCATDSGVVRYNREFERMEAVPAAPKYAYSYIINTPSRFWFIAQDHFVAYKKDTEEWTTYPAHAMSDYAHLGDSLFVVSDGTVYFFDPGSDSWREFREIKLDNVNGISVDEENIFFATVQGLLIYNWLETSRTVYNRNNGLEYDSLIDVYQDSKFIFVISQYAIEYLDTETAIWHIEQLKPPGEKREKIFYLDEVGAHAHLINDVDIVLQGRAFYSTIHSIAETHMSSSNENINLKLIGKHSSNRLLALYYDDTDKEQVMYGFGYRGLEEDVLYRCNGGYLTSEYYEFDIVPTFSTFGGNAKLRYTSHSMEIQGGQLKSRPQTDFFTGRQSENNLILFDTHYSKNTFYSIYSTPQMITMGFDTLFVDDRIARTNKIDTRIGYTIGGITGDFDVLINGIDYFIDYNRGTVHFLDPRNNSDILVLLSNSEEIVLQSDSVTGHELENIYFIGTSIIPNSLVLTITDTTGQEHPLTEFGLDNNGDNRVDAEFIQYNIGYLSFPQSRPFPDEVYDATVHIYTMDIQFLSQSVFYFLSHKPILKKSEKIYVDGTQVTSGIDYIIDYTSGILLFLNEDIVSDFSEIEIHYASVERQGEDIFYSVQPNIGINNNINIAPGFSSIKDEQIFHISGRFQTGTGNTSVKFIPQVAVNDEQAWAQDYSLITNYSILSVNTEYRGFSQEFETFESSEKKYGSLRHSGLIIARLEPLTSVQLEGMFKREYQVDSLENQYIAQYMHGKFNYVHPKLPNGYILVGKDNLPDYEKWKIQVNANYDFHILKSRIKTSSVVRNIITHFNEEKKNKILEYILHTNFSFPFMVYGDVYYRHNQIYMNTAEEKCEEEIRGALNVDVIPGFYYTGNYSFQATTFFIDTVQDISLRYYFYNNLNIAPGRWYTKLSIVNLSCGIGSNFNEYISSLPGAYERPFFVMKPLEDGFLSSMTRLDSYYGMIQFTPFSNFLIWAKHTMSKSGFAYYTMPDSKPTTKDEIKIEYEPKYVGFLIASWSRRNHKSYPTEITDNIYFEWNKPWSVMLRTKLSTNYSIDRDDYGWIREIDYSELRVDFETLVRFTTKSFITLNLGGMKQETDQDGVTYSLLPGVSINANFFMFLFLRFDYTSTIPIHGSAVHTLSAKIAGQF